MNKNRAQTSALPFALAGSPPFWLSLLGWSRPNPADEAEAKAPISETNSPADEPRRRPVVALTWW